MLRWARSFQKNNKVDRVLKDQFFAIGLNEEFQQIEVAYAKRIFNQALNLCGEYGLKSERAVALMFDICVQNGSISAATKSLIVADFKNLQSTCDAQQDEVNKLVIIANRRADASKNAWKENVRMRKLCIATGQGTVHGKNYDLAADFGISLEPVL